MNQIKIIGSVLLIYVILLGILGLFIRGIKETVVKEDLKIETIESNNHIEGFKVIITDLEDNSKTTIQADKAYLINEPATINYKENE